MPVAHVAFAVGLAFAVHPMRAESVAWVSERKDLLSGCFFFIAIIAWVEWSRHRNQLFYLVSIIAFIIGLLSKSMLVTTPAVLALLELGVLSSPTWNRVRWLVPRLVPFAMITVAFSALTLATQVNAIEDEAVFPLARRLSSVPVNYVSYLRETLWPFSLSPMHPVDANGDPATTVIASTLLLVGLTTALWRLRDRAPLALVGWLWFLGMLVPVGGIVQVGMMSIANRYTYLPHVGLFLTIVAVARLIHERTTWLIMATSIGLLPTTVAEEGCQPTVKKTPIPPAKGTHPFVQAFVADVVPNIPALRFCFSR